ncbi:MAG: hypothetical protein V7K18_20695 [Nostoc sp.]
MVNDTDVMQIDLVTLIQAAIAHLFQQNNYYSKGLGTGDWGLGEKPFCV